MVKRLLLLTLISFFCFPLFGAHIVGGELTYECQGDDPNNPGNKIYLFTLTVYRDCFGMGANFDSAPGSPDASLTLFQASNGGFITLDSFFLDTVGVVQVDVETILNNPCVIVPTNVCLERGQYQFHRSLPVINESYVMTYQRCCRNQTISNIITPGDVGATFTIEITPFAQTVCNSSPTFNSFPPPVICVDEPIDFDHSATDPDGDLLVYSLCTPLKGGGNMFGGPANGPNTPTPHPDLAPPYFPVDFIVPNFTFTNPLGTMPPMAIDDGTGFLTGTPSIQGQFVVGICVEEYRNGQLLSVVQRDFQFNVTFCEPTVVAELDGNEVDGFYQYVSCDNTVIYFDNESYNQDFIDDYFWEFYLPDTTLQFSSVNVTVDFEETGMYTGQMILNPNTECSDTALLDINIVPEINAEFNFEYDTCVADSVQFFDLTDATGLELSTWVWNFTPTENGFGQQPAYFFEDPGNYTVTLTVYDSSGCFGSTSEEVTWFPVPPLLIVSPNVFRGCPPQEVYFENLSEPIDETYQIFWDFGNGDTAQAISPTYTYPSPGTYDVSLEITSPIGCFTDTVFSKLIAVYERPVADFFYSPETFSNFAPEVQFEDASSTDVVAWLWTFNGADRNYEQHPTYVFPDTGLYAVQLMVANENTCEDTIVKFIDVEPLITYFLPNAFTPNADDKNDEFAGKGVLRGMQDFNLYIWDRYGAMIFHTTDPYEGWNGRYQNSGKLLQNGVYVVVVEYKKPRGEPVRHQGVVTLFR